MISLNNGTSEDTKNMKSQVKCDQQIQNHRAILVYKPLKGPRVYYIGVGVICNKEPKNKTK